MPNDDDHDPVADTPLIVRARAILAPIERNRQILTLRNAGVSDADIAARLGITTAVVGHVARRDADILTRAPSPLEVIARHILGECSHDDLMNDLLARQYTAGYIQDGSYDGWVRGTWSEIEIAMATGMISDSDFLQLLTLKAEPGSADGDLPGQTTQPSRRTPRGPSTTTGLEPGDTVTRLPDQLFSSIPTMFWRDGGGSA